MPNTGTNRLAICAAIMFTMLNEQLYKLALDVTLAVYVTDQGCRDVAHFCCVSEDARIVSR